MMEVLKEKYSITELSQRLDVTDHTLRYYEKEFNLQVPKDGRGRRYYTPELANLMFQIKEMRKDGLEIKAIRRILQSENIIKEPPPVVVEENTMSVVPMQQSTQSPDIKRFFEDFREELTGCITSEVASVKDHLSKEMTKTKLELGACVENSSRKLEAKLDKHFQEIDRYLGIWREKNKGNGFLNRFLKK